MTGRNVARDGREGRDRQEGVGKGTKGKGNERKRKERSDRTVEDRTG